MSESCIIRQFQHYAELTEHEIELLTRLEKNSQVIAAGRIIRPVDCNAEMFFTVKNGWAMACREMQDGDRQILDVFLPGQVMGLREIGFTRTLSELSAVTEVEVCPFPKRQLTEVFEASARLADLFFLIMAREQSLLIERVINLGRRSAEQRLAHFIAELHMRLQITHPDGLDRFPLPMTQAQIGDTLGLSAVHVSRSFSRIKQRDLIRINSGELEILDRQTLYELGDFNPAYLTEDTDWIRNAPS